MKIVCTTLLIEKSPQALPLGAACIASALKHNSSTKDMCQVVLKAFSAEDEDYINAGSSDSQKSDFIVKKLLEEKPNIVCFSVFMWNRKVLSLAGVTLRKKGIVCIAGGPEVTANPYGFSEFNFLVSGEGELSVPEVVKKIADEKITADSKSQVVMSPLCNDFSFSPYLDQTLDPAEYEGALWELARGCPFKCSYCYESKGSKTVRHLPMERIEKELDLFARKKVPQVFVLDPTYNSSKKRAVELINLIAKKTPDTFYYFEARAEFIDRELAHAFTKIPCALQIGLQSADDAVLRLVNRNINRKQFSRNIGYLNEEGIVFGLDLIYGLPSESLNGFKDGIDYAISLYPNNLELFCLSVLPGTDLFDRAKELHLEFESTPPYHVIKTDKISEKEIAAAQKIALSCSVFYNDGRAVPWFNTICHALRIKPSAFFELFGKTYGASPVFKNCSCGGTSHKEIENLQIEFVRKLLREKKLERLEKAAVDLIRFNGALARTQETGKSEKVSLSYNSEYLASPYASDLLFFVKNFKPGPNVINTFKKGNFADWR